MAGIEPSIRVGVSLTGGWGKVGALLAPYMRLQMVQHMAIQQEAEFFRTKIVEGIRDQAPGGKAFKPLSPYTIAMRTFLRLKSEKALIERGDLIRNIKVHKVGLGTVFVGILRGTASSDGKDLINIGLIHEYGAGPFVIKLTPKMLAFLHMVFRRMRIPAARGGHGRGYLLITIPPRPFLGPVFEQYAAAAQARIEARVAALMLAVR